MSRRFFADLSERAIKSFLQGFGLAWGAASTGLAPGDWQGLKALAWGASMAGLSAVSSVLSKLNGDPDSASASATVDRLGATAGLDLAAITAAVADRLGRVTRPPTSTVPAEQLPGAVSVADPALRPVQGHTEGVDYWPTEGDTDDDQLGH